MIWCTTENFARVWQVEMLEKRARVNFSTSEKDSKTGQTAYSSWYASFVGHAFNKAKAENLKGNDRIKITKMKIQRRGYTNEKTGKREFPTDILVLEYELANFDDNKPNDGNVTAPAAATVNSTAPQPPTPVSDDDDDMPF